jgi:hypothetical protein
VDPANLDVIVGRVSHRGMSAHSSTRATTTNAAATYT